MDWLRLGLAPADILLLIGCTSWQAGKQASKPSSAQRWRQHCFKWQALSWERSNGVLTAASEQRATQTQATACSQPTSSPYTSPRRPPDIMLIKTTAHQPTHTHTRARACTQTTSNVDRHTLTFRVVDSTARTDPKRKSRRRRSFRCFHSYKITRFFLFPVATDVLLHDDFAGTSANYYYATFLP